MSDRIRTLVLDANGWGGWKAVSSETVIRGVLGVNDLDRLPKPLRNLRFIRHVLRDRYASLSYVKDWRDALAASPRLDVELCNVVNLVEFARVRRKIAEYPLVIVLHSATGDNMSVLQRACSWFQGRRGKLVVFIGNEYNLLKAKVGFVRDTGADYVASQLPIDSARWLYADCTRTEVLSMPHALNPTLYHPRPEVRRKTDIGFVGAEYPMFIGDQERASILEYFRCNGSRHGLQVDIRQKNLPRDEWASFLAGCGGVIGAEAGTYYLDRTGTLIPEIETYLQRHPKAEFQTIYERFFRDRPIVKSGKAISSRHFEPIGTRTCQLLLEGEYNGILQADEHYIAIRKDLSNITDALARFRDCTYRAAMVTRSFDYVMAEHTYDRRVEQLLTHVT